MKAFLAVVSMYLVICFAGAFGEYVGGRIVLPDVGLTAPEYWTWFWFTFWTGGIAFALAFLKVILFD